MHLRPLVKAVSLALVLDRQVRFLNNLHLLPGLKNVDGLGWPHHIHPPLALELRPRLASLWAAGGTLANLSRWFNLDGLDRLRISGPVHVESLAELPVSLRDVALDGVHGQDIAPALSALSCCAGLTRLRVVATGANHASGIDDNPLAVFPALRELDLVNTPSLSHLMSVPHAALRTLSIGPPSTEGSSGFPASHPLHHFVDNLCAIRRANPSRHAALHTVKLIPTWPPLRLETEGDRRVAGVREMARKLRAVGLRVQDSYGVEWRDEWSGEAGTG